MAYCATHFLQATAPMEPRERAPGILSRARVLRARQAAPSSKHNEHILFGLVCSREHAVHDQVERQRLRAVISPRPRRRPPSGLTSCRPVPTCSLPPCPGCKTQQLACT